MSTQVQAAEATLAGERLTITVSAVKTGDAQIDLIGLCLSAVKACPMCEEDVAMAFELLAKRFHLAWECLEKMRAKTGIGYSVMNTDVAYGQLPSRGIGQGIASGSGVSSTGASTVPFKSPFTPPCNGMHDDGGLD